jgi:hypothetical protein
MERSPSPIPVNPAPDEAARAAPEETLVADVRACLTPAQMVVRKLFVLLKHNPFLLSCAIGALQQYRGRC